MATRREMKERVMSVAIFGTATGAFFNSLLEESGKTESNTALLVLYALVTCVLAGATITAITRIFRIIDGKYAGDEHEG